MPKRLTGRGGAGRNQGRKPLHPGELTVVKSLRLPLSQAEKLHRLGGNEWVRKQISKAREPKP